MIWTAIIRIIWVPAAFFVSALVVGVVLAMLISERITKAMVSQDLLSLESIDSYLEVFKTGQHLSSALTILPAIALVIIGEVASIRSAIYYVLGGGAALAAIPLLARLNQTTGGMLVPTEAVWHIFATAGFAGGLVYWLLAGRRA